MNSTPNNTPAALQPRVSRIGTTVSTSATDARADGAAGRSGEAAHFISLLLILVVIGFSSLIAANRSFAPEMYTETTPAAIGETLARGRNYALFDLNVDIRAIRDAQLGALRATPDIVILGASHWQEAPASLLPHKTMLNAHIHRDYYEDMLGMVGMLVKHDRLPRQLMIAVRDNQFTPISLRKDDLWVQGISYFTATAERMGIEPQGMLETLPLARAQQLVSVQMLVRNVKRWYAATERPHVTDAVRFEALDVLRSDGSIVWSRQHEAGFTQERARRTALDYVAERRNAPPVIDPKGVDILDRVLAFLKAQGVQVFLAHPPFNPVTWAGLKDEPYRVGLKGVEEIAAKLADRHGFQVIGSFDPSRLGCDESMFIDAEHANARCLSRIFDQISNADRRERVQAPASVVTEGP